MSEQNPGQMELDALRSIGYGMYVIGSRKGDRLNAQIANTVFQITSDPPTVAVSINKKNLTHEFIEDSRAFSASTLCEDTPLSFIGRFGFKSGRDTDKLAGVAYHIGQTKSPVITENAVSYLEVQVTKAVDMGTHTVFIGEVVAARVLSAKACMTYAYYHEVKRGTTPKTAPTYAAH
jgi:flavin reductase (DIM6/NTAB) family NADH-FMN oxidoreductase RutF